MRGRRRRKRSRNGRRKIVKPRVNFRRARKGGRKGERQRKRQRVLREYLRLVRGWDVCMAERRAGTYARFPID